MGSLSSDHEDGRLKWPQLILGRWVGPFYSDRQFLQLVMQGHEVGLTLIAGLGSRVVH
jgi:hypothetical protein